MSFSPGPTSPGNRKGLTNFSSTVDRKSVPVFVLVPVLCVRIVPVPFAGGKNVVRRWRWDNIKVLWMVVVRKRY